MAIEIPLLPSFLYLFNEDENLASFCILAKINIFSLISSLLGSQSNHFSVGCQSNQFFVRCSV